MGMMRELFTSPLSNLAQGMTQPQSAAAAGDRVFDFLSQEELPDESGKIRSLPQVRGEVEFDRVPTSRLHRRRAVSGQPHRLRAVRRHIADHADPDACARILLASMDAQVRFCVHKKFGIRRLKTPARNARIQGTNRALRAGKRKIP